MEKLVLEEKRTVKKHVSDGLPGKFSLMNNFLQGGQRS